MAAVKTAVVSRVAENTAEENMGVVNKEAENSVVVVGILLTRLALC